MAAAKLLNKERNAQVCDATKAPSLLRSPAHKQKKSKENDLRFFVGLPGLEPRITEPKSAVLPLHHRPILKWGAKIAFAVKSSKTF